LYYYIKIRLKRRFFKFAPPVFGIKWANCRSDPVLARRPFAAADVNFAEKMVSAGFFDLHFSENVAFFVPCPQKV